MKHIKKGAAPRELKAWFKNQPIVDGERINCRYDKNLESDVKDIIRNNLVAEQGGLCCYTGMIITSGECHIEHLTPQAVSRQNGTHEDVDYKNMLAAYPRRDSCPFGARIRGDRHLKVHPLQPTCESKFRFDMDGHIFGVDEDAVETISTLKLDHDLLNQMRRDAIDEALFPHDHPISEAKAQVMLEHYCTINKAGRYPKFCFVVAQAAQQYLQKIERERRRKQAIQKQAKS